MSDDGVRVPPPAPTKHAIQAGKVLRGGTPGFQPGRAGSRPATCSKQCLGGRLGRHCFYKAALGVFDSHPKHQTMEQIVVPRQPNTISGRLTEWFKVAGC